MEVRVVMLNDTVDCCFGGKEFQMRKCGGKPLWSVLLKHGGVWVSIFLVSSAPPPLKWINLVYSRTELLTPLDYRRFAIFNKA